MLKNMLKVLAVLIVVFLVVGVFLPSSYEVSRSKEITATPDLVFDQVNNLKQSESWSPWGEGDATMKITYSGPEAGVGAKGAWTSADSGAGSQTITKSVPHNLIEMALDFGSEGNGSAAYTFTQSGETTKVNWSMRGDVGFNLIGRYFGLFMDKMLGGYFEKGLSNLKRVAETAAVTRKQDLAKQEEEAAARRKMVLRVGGLHTPESMLYDAVGDVYLVSNINGSPFAADDNGYIARVGADGSVIEALWIDGANAAVVLNAPKGMTIAGDVLYVADINTVRMFDRASGTPKGEIKVKGATFLNDMATGPDGVVYVSDSGLKEGFAASGTDAIYKLVDGKPVVLIKNKDLGRPNGLLAQAAGLWVVTFGSGELYSVGPDGTKANAQVLPTGSLDGIVQLNDGRFAVSSWAGSAVLAGNPGGTFTVLIADTKSPADIGYDSNRNRVLIPLFEDNIVQVTPL